MASVKEIWLWDFQCYKKEKKFIALSQRFSLNNYYIIWYLQYFQRNTFSAFVFSSNISMILDFPNECYTSDRTVNVYATIPITESDTVSATYNGIVSKTTQ